MPRTQAQMETDLADLIPEIGAVVRAALVQYVQKYGPLRHEQSPRSRASIIVDLMHAEVEKRFERTAGVRVFRKSSTIYLGLHGKYVTKFKKLSSAKLAACTGTQTSMSFAAQQVQQTTFVPFPEAPTNLFAGYILDESEIAKSSTWIVCPNGNGKPHWTYPVPAVEPVVIPLVARLTKTKTDEPRRRRAKAKAKTTLTIVKNKSE